MNLKDLLTGQVVCPQCGHTYNPIPSGPWSRKSLQVFGTGPSMPAGSTYEKVEPARGADVKGDVVVPLAQAATTTIVAFGTTLGVCLWLDADVRLSIGAAVATMGYSWVTLLNDHRDNLTKREVISAEPAVSQPQLASAPIILRTPANTKVVASEVANAVEPEPLHIDHLEPVDPNEVLYQDLSEFLVRGQRVGYTLRHWRGQRLSSGTRVSDPCWREWTGWLSNANILQVDRGGTRLRSGVTLRDALECISCEARQ